MSKPKKSVKPKIHCAPGYCLSTPYLEKDVTFQTNRENHGEDVMSTIIEVGNPIMDEGGHYRSAPCKAGDIVLSTDSNKTFTHDFTNYRFIHFSEVHGVLNI